MVVPPVFAPPRCPGMDLIGQLSSLPSPTHLHYREHRNGGHFKAVCARHKIFTQVDHHWMEERKAKAAPLLSRCNAWSSSAECGSNGDRDRQNRAGKDPPREAKPKRSHLAWRSGFVIGPLSDPSFGWRRVAGLPAQPQLMSCAACDDCGEKSISCAREGRY